MNASIQALEEVQFAMSGAAAELGLKDEKDVVNMVKEIRSEKMAKRFRAGAEAIQKIIGQDVPWASEEDMIEELTEERRKKRTAHHGERREN